MNGTWLGAPIAAMRVWPAARGPHWRLNAAARAWRERNAITPAAWVAVTTEVFTQLSQARLLSGHLRSVLLHWQAAPLRLGWLVWLLPPGARESSWDRDPQPGATVAAGRTAGIFERRRAHALSRQVELAAESAKLGMWSIDLTRGTVEWNPEMFTIYGLPLERLPVDAASWGRDHVHPDDLPALRRVGRRERSATGPATSFELEFRIRRGDGTQRWIVARSRREQTEDGVRLVGIHLDVTEWVRQRERAEQAVHEKEIAQHATRVKSAFLARVSHELRTPLNAVLGFAQLVEHDALAVPMTLQLERVHHIRLAGEHLLGLVDDLIDLATLDDATDPAPLEPVAVAAVLSEVARWFELQASVAEVRIHVDACDGWVRGVPRRVRQIVANLVSNAVKFNRRGGTVWLRFGRGAAHDGATCYISVRDDGRGFETGQQRRAFEAFDRLGAERDGIPGVGMGLAIVERLARVMKGRVEFRSVVGVGSEFRVWLQDAGRGDAPAPTPRPPLAGGDGPERERLELLYIEDNPVNVLLVQEIVALRPGMHLTCAEDGESGVVAARSLRPDIVLIDMHLPDFDGYEVLRRLRADPGTLRQVRIALSANSLDSDIAAALEQGFDDYWTKPIDLQRFLGALDALGERLRTPNLPSQGPDARGAGRVRT